MSKIPLREASTDQKFDKKKELFLFVVLVFVLALTLIGSNVKKTTQTFQSKAQGSSFFGFNIHSLGTDSQTNINSYLDYIKSCQNSNVVRFWGFINGEMNTIDKVLNSGSSLQYIIALSNYYSNPANQKWPAPESDPTNWFSTGYKTNGFRDYVDTVTKKYGSHPNVYGWEIMNEPNCTADAACATAQHQFLDDISTLIAQNSPGKLISPGLQGQNTGGEHFDNGDYETITKLPHITANSCHLYTDAPAGEANCQKALEITKAAGKTFYIGEMGVTGNCTTQGCTNQCNNTDLAARQKIILDTYNKWKSAGAEGFLVWQFSPLQSSALYCDDKSIFPGDPLCGSNTLPPPQNPPPNNQPPPTNQTNTTGNSLTFNPPNPAANAQFTAIGGSNIAYAWVHMKIFDATGANLVWEAPKDGTQPMVTGGKPIKWTFTVKAGLNTGSYKAVFYANCNKGCSQVATGTVTVGSGNTNNPPPNNNPPVNNPPVNNPPINNPPPIVTSPPNICRGRGTIQTKIKIDTNLCADGSIDPSFSSSYVPTGLVPINDVIGNLVTLPKRSNPMMLKQEALTALVNFLTLSDLKKVTRPDGLPLCLFPLIYDAYRSYADQQAIWNQNDCDAKTAAGTWCGVARPGSSMHQSGIAVDLFCQNYEKVVNADTVDYKITPNSYATIPQSVKNQAKDYGLLFDTVSGDPAHIIIVGQ